MQRKFLVVAVLLAVLVAVFLSGLILASRYERFIFTRDLSVEEFKQISEGAYAANVSDDGARVASIYIRVDHAIGQAHYCPVLVSIWHSEDTELDSLYLSFTGNSFIQVYLETPGGSVPPVHLYESYNGLKGVAVKFDDLGFYGTGTVTLNFLLWPSSNLENFRFETEFYMHAKTLMQLTGQKAFKSTEIPFYQA
jgi:hypothetical protein